LPGHRRHGAWADVDATSKTVRLIHVMAPTAPAHGGPARQPEAHCI
jgi:hypothetical protein